MKKLIKGLLVALAAFPITLLFLLAAWVFGSGTPDAERRWRDLP